MRRFHDHSAADDAVAKRLQLGRFFAESCQSEVLDEETRKSFVLQYTGKGYAWTNVSGKLGFSSRGLVEYAPDFQLSDGALYVYFRPKTVDAAAFQLLSVDSALAQAGMAVAADRDGASLSHWTRTSG